MTVADTYRTDPLEGEPDGGIMRRLNVVTGIAGGLLLALVFNQVAKSLAKDAVHEVDVRATATMVGWAVGFMAGLGAFTGSAALDGRAETSPTPTSCSSPARTRVSAATSGSPPTTRSSGSSTSCSP